MFFELEEKISALILVKYLRRFLKQDRIKTKILAFFINNNRDYTTITVSLQLIY